MTLYYDPSSEDDRYDDIIYFDYEAIQHRLFKEIHIPTGKSKQVTSNLISDS